jgi:glycosyltransferase involved in cell wall biosynthesis
MRIAFYAPLKPPTHPVASGDRRVARLLMEALTLAGHEVELASRLRSYDGGGDRERQNRIAMVGSKLAAVMIARLRGRPLSQRPRLWLTYHPYYKAPDWLGPRIANALAIPYVVAECSVAMKRSGGPWSMGHEATLAALRRAAMCISLNPTDDAGIAPHLAEPGRLASLKPFIDSWPYRRAARERAANCISVWQRYSLPASMPKLLTVAMMRPGDKLASYAVLAQALERLGDLPWCLLVVGDGSACESVEALFDPFGLARIRFAGFVTETELARIYAAADLLVWPAINEAYGMSLLEAQAAGLPAVVGRSGGVATIVDDGKTGLLTPSGDVDAFARAIAALLDDRPRREAMGQAAQAKVAAEHDLAAASRALDAILRRACGERAAEGA